MQCGDVLAPQGSSHVGRERQAEHGSERFRLPPDVLGRLRQRSRRVLAVDECRLVQKGDAPLQRQPHRQIRPFEIRRHALEVRGGNGRGPEQTGAGLEPHPVYHRSQRVGGTPGDVRHVEDIASGAAQVPAGDYRVRPAIGLHARDARGQRSRQQQVVIVELHEVGRVDEPAPGGDRPREPALAATQETDVPALCERAQQIVIAVRPVGDHDGIDANALLSQHALQRATETSRTACQGHRRKDHGHDGGRVHRNMCSLVYGNPPASKASARVVRSPSSRPRAHSASLLPAGRTRRPGSTASAVRSGRDVAPLRRRGLAAGLCLWNG